MAEIRCGGAARVTVHVTAAVELSSARGDRRWPPGGRRLGLPPDTVGYNRLRSRLCPFPSIPFTWSSSDKSGTGLGWALLSGAVQVARHAGLRVLSTPGYRLSSRSPTGGSSQAPHLPRLLKRITSLRVFRGAADERAPVSGTVWRPANRLGTLVCVQPTGPPDSIALPSLPSTAHLYAWSAHWTTSQFPRPPLVLSSASVTYKYAPSKPPFPPRHTAPLSPRHTPS